MAEGISTLDLVSDGRVEFGSGEASTVAELDGFRVDPGEKRAQWEEATRAALRCMTETPFTGLEGKYVSMHAPGNTDLWSMYAGAIGADPSVGYAPESGPVGTPETVRAWCECYEAAGLVGD